jgi:hypothetical protein
MDFYLKQLHEQIAIQKAIQKEIILVLQEVMPGA